MSWLLDDEKFGPVVPSVCLSIRPSLPVCTVGIKIFYTVRSAYLYVCWLSVCLTVCIYVDLSLSVCLYDRPSVYMSVSVCLDYMYVCLSVQTSVSPFNHLSTPSVRLGVGPSTCVSIFLSVSLPAPPTICLSSVYPPISLAVCLPVCLFELQSVCLFLKSIGPVFPSVWLSVRSSFRLPAFVSVCLLVCSSQIPPISLCVFTDGQSFNTYVHISVSPSVNLPPACLCRYAA